MAATTMIHVRLDQQVKEDALAALEAMGLSVSDAVRALLTRVAAEKALPFALRVPQCHNAHSDGRSRRDGADWPRALPYRRGPDHVT